MDSTPQPPPPDTTTSSDPTHSTTRLHPSYSELDYLSHRHSPQLYSSYVHSLPPGTADRREKSKRHGHHGHHHKSKYNKNGKNGDTNNPVAAGETKPVTPPSTRVQFILGGSDFSSTDPTSFDSTHESHPLFSEMEELVLEPSGEFEWKETARWIRFEEDVEKGGQRWSKPHVATLSLHSLFELRSLLLNNIVMLDMEAFTLETIADLLLDNCINAGQLQPESRDKVREALLRRHRHLHEKKIDQHEKTTSSSSGVWGATRGLPIIRSLAEIGRIHSSGNTKATLESSSSKPTPPTPTPTPNTTIEKDMHLGGNLLSVPGAPAIIPPTTDDPTHPPNLPTSSSFSGLIRPNPSSSNLIENIPGDVPRGNLHFMRKIPPGAEASNILVGEVDFLDRPLSAFVRLSSAVFLGDLTEVPVPTRFLFVLLGPMGGISRYHEVGRAMATLMSDEVFHDVAYKAKNRGHLLAGVDEFLDAVTVLPPGEWDPSIRIEPPASVPSQDPRKGINKQNLKTNESSSSFMMGGGGDSGGGSGGGNTNFEDFEKNQLVEGGGDEELLEQKLREESGLTRSGRLFGGLINDIKRKRGWYLSDFTDSLSLQCLSSFLFLYFACLTPIITFGGLLGKETEQNMAAIESLVSGFVCGIVYGLFSGQPLTILGSTGPVLVFEKIVYGVCSSNSWNYLEFRLWIGIWIGLILITLVALDASAFVCYITRFTEENFATLIAFIFMYEALNNVLEIRKTAPVNPHFNGTSESLNCYCQLPDVGPNFWTGNVSFNECEKSLNGTLTGLGCSYVPDVFLMSVLLFIGTFLISVVLKDFKTTGFFPTSIRSTISDFSVILSILLMSSLDAYMNLATPKLTVPSEFKPTRDDRKWIVDPFAKNPGWTVVAAVLPALLACILIFMDQQITAVIINRKEHKLKKSCGYHLDLFVLSLLIILCSFLGIPWFVAATVLSMNHVNSLRMESETAAPGEKPQFLGVREQRVTHILIFLMIGLSVLLTPVLGLIPMPVLYGVFLYMGFASLKGMQFFERLLIMCMPSKYQPDYMYLRQVPLLRVHLFTLIQLACLVLLWLIKSFPKTRILFPVMLVVMIIVRKLLDYVFTQRELKILDDIMPESSRRKDKHKNEKSGAEVIITKGTISGGPILDSSANLTVPLPNGNVIKIPIKNVNISEEVNKTGIWKELEGRNLKQINFKADKKSSSSSSKKSTSKNAPSKKRNPLKKDWVSDEEKRRLSTIDGENEEDNNLVTNSNEIGAGLIVKDENLVPNVVIKVQLPSPQPETRRASLGRSILNNSTANNNSAGNNDNDNCSHGGGDETEV